MSDADAVEFAWKTSSCRVCGADLPAPFLDLGNQPLANAYSSSDVELPTVPLAVTRCPSCTMQQLTHTVDPSAMFVDYAYQSSVSSTWVRHCADHIDSLLADGTIETGSTVVEVASNDGYLLRHMKARGLRCFGVEPATNLADEANTEGLRTLNVFMGVASIEGILAETGPANLVIANNVLAHVPDPVDFLSGIAGILAADGRLSIESPHALRLLEGMQFDTVYHEHVFYLTAEAVSVAAGRAGLELISIEPVATHGGSLRMTMAHRGAFAVDQSVADCLAEEQSSELLTVAGLADFGVRVEALKHEVLQLLDRSITEGARWAAFGAAAKGVVFANYLGLDNSKVEFVIDNNPLKQGKVMPGTGIPIMPLTHLGQASHITDVLIFAWNIAAELSAEIGETCDWPIRVWAALPSLHQI